MSQRSSLIPLIQLVREQFQQEAEEHSLAVKQAIRKIRSRLLLDAYRRMSANVLQRFFRLRERRTYAEAWFSWILAIPFFAQCADIAWQADVQKPFALSIKLSAEQINLDDLLYLDAEFRYPSSHQLNMNELIDQLAWSANPLAPLLNVYQTTISSLPADEGITAQKLHAAIRPLVKGALDVSFLKVAFQPKDKAQSPLEILTPVFTIQVAPPISSQTPSLLL